MILRVGAVALLQVGLMLWLVLGIGVSVVIQHDYYGVAAGSCYVAFNNYGIDDWGC